MFSAGAKMGFNIAYLTGAAGLSTFPVLGFCGGVFGTFNMGPVFALQAEALFSMKGGYVYEVYPEIEKVGRRFNYLEIPALLRINFAFGSKSKLVPFFCVGPYWGLKIGSSHSGQALFSPYSPVSSDGPSSTDQSIGSGLIEEKGGDDMGLVLGAGCDMRMGRGALVIDGRLSFGFVKVAEFGFFEGALSNLKNFAITTMVGYAF